MMSNREKDMLDQYLTTERDWRLDAEDGDEEDGYWDEQEQEDYESELDDRN